MCRSSGAVGDPAAPCSPWEGRRATLPHPACRGQTGSTAAWDGRRSFEPGPQTRRRCPTRSSLRNLEGGTKKHQHSSRNLLGLTSHPPSLLTCAGKGANLKAPLAQIVVIPHLKTKQNKKNKQKNARTRTVTHTLHAALSNDGLKNITWKHVQGVTEWREMFILFHLCR